MNNTDLIIIGAGPGGYETAVEAAAHGLQVTIFEEATPGGTCLNEGCIPTKALCRNAEVADTLRHAAEFGVTVPSDSIAGFNIDMPTIQARKQAIVSQLVSGVEGLLAKPGITLVRAHAEFKESPLPSMAGGETVAHTVTADGQEYTAPNVIIATGSTTKMLPIPGIDLPSVLTSKEMLCIDHVPQRLCVIGAGVIGIEFASIFSRLGSEVTMVEFAKEILPPLDSDVAKRLRQSLTKSGIAFNLSAAVTAIEPLCLEIPSQGLRVKFEQKGKPCEVEADNVLMAVGRAPRINGINLEATGADFSPRGIVVDENYAVVTRQSREQSGNMQTTVPGLYAIGDVNARCMLAHAATAQGFRALNHILQKANNCQLSTAKQSRAAGESKAVILNYQLNVIPAAVFCHPEAAMVGLTEDQCKAQGIDVKVGKAFFRANGKALAMGEPDGYVKLLSKKESGRILGCHLFGPHAADLVQEVASLMTHDGTVQQLACTVHSHPTLGEAIMAAAK